MLIGNRQVSQAAEILHQHQLERDGQSPELADRQPGHLLIGGNKAPEAIFLVQAVTVRDISPGDPEHARQAGQRSLRQFRQLPVEIRRQIITNLAYLLFDDVIVIDQPLGRRRDRPVQIKRPGRFRIDSRQRLGVFIESDQQLARARAAIFNALCPGQRSAVIVKPIIAEQLRTHRAIARPYPRLQARLAQQPRQSGKPGAFVVKCHER